MMRAFLLSVLLLCVSIYGVRGKCTAPSFFGTEEEGLLVKLKAQGGARARSVRELCNAVLNLAGHKHVVEHFKKYHEGVVAEGDGCSVCHWEDGRLPHEQDSHDKGARLIESFRAVLAHLSEDGVFNDQYPDFKLSESAPTCLGQAKKLLTCFNSIFPYENLPHDTKTDDYTLFDVSIYKPLTGLVALSPSADAFCAKLAERMEEGKCDAAKTEMGDKIRLQPFKADDKYGVTLMCTQSKQAIPLKSFVRKMKDTVEKYRKQPTIKESIKKFWGSQSQVDWYDIQSNQAYKSYYGTEKDSLHAVCEAKLKVCGAGASEPSNSPYSRFVQGLCEAMTEHTIPFWIYQLDFAEMYKGKSELTYDATLSEEQLLKLIYQRLHQALSFSVLDATEPAKPLTATEEAEEAEEEEDVEEVENGGVEPPKTGKKGKKTTTETETVETEEEEDSELAASDEASTTGSGKKSTAPKPKPIGAKEKAKAKKTDGSEEEEEEEEEAQTEV
eukprot:GILK01000822.1.p1 GENE.GILK01000822.1~~GILK01000822.1.p1  ORF type:complete len:499 (-),score=116.69 GILK01000822.1:218-1714(-)